MLGYYSDPFTFGSYSEDEDEAGLDSDSDLTPCCEICEVAVDERGYCADCEVFNDA